ncbi:MAG: hypothetical protein GY917_31145 [Planctomycetaceae bacterium]|nr:hypothetical protein [Planctomycetaceae bacterium]
MSNRAVRSHRVPRESLFSLAYRTIPILVMSLVAMAPGKSAHLLQANEPSETEESKESKEAAEFYEFYTFYQSKWQIEKETEGKKETFTAQCSGSAGGCNIYVGKGETSIWGYNPKTRQWTGTGQLDNGSRYVMAISRPPGPKFIPGMTFTFTGTIWHADGTVNYVTNKSSCVDKDTIREVTTGTDQDGKAIPKVTTTLKRIN